MYMLNLIKISAVFALSVLPCSTIFRKNTLFDICYINLEIENETNSNLKAMLAFAETSFVRFNAVSGIDLAMGYRTPEYYTKPYNIKSYQSLRMFEKIPQELADMSGRKLSHYLNFLRISKARGKKPVLILEDRVDIKCNFVEKIEEALEELPSNWDVLLLTEDYDDYGYYFINHLNILKIDSFDSCFGFLVNGNSSAKKIARIIQNNCSKKTPIDTFLKSKAAFYGLQIYSMKQQLVTKTSIADLMLLYPSQYNNDDDNEFLSFYLFKN